MSTDPRPTDNAGALRLQKCCYMDQLYSLLFYWSKVFGSEALLLDAYVRPISKDYRRTRLCRMDQSTQNMDVCKAAATMRELSNPQKAVRTIVSATANAFVEYKKGHIAKPLRVEKLMHVLKKESAGEGGIE